MQKNAIAALERNLTSLLKNEGFNPSTTRSVISPRHMAVKSQGWKHNLPIVFLRKGPRTSAPDKAIDGFCQSAGLERSQLEVRDTEKAISRINAGQGAALKGVLPAILQQHKKNSLAQKPALGRDIYPLGASATPDFRKH